MELKDNLNLVTKLQIYAGLKVFKINENGHYKRTVHILQIVPEQSYPLILSLYIYTYMYM